LSLFRSFSQAKTGSGKTLAFVVPVLELLYREEVTPEDGPCAIVLSPTRELAMQIFQVVKVAGRCHSLSVGLLIGGQKKDFDLEQQRVGSTNVIIASPGRLLQHLEQTPYFDVSGLKILVLDEADRILDMGFREQLLRILEYLPRDRQTLLFSATQTRDVSHLATLSLQQPEYLGVHDKEKTATPENLQQSYVVVPLEHKLNALYSFVRTHLKSKCIVFFASCAQIRHAWELFCSLRPGIPVLALHGKIVQDKRTHIYFDFCQRPHAILLASDVCARGLDFPSVDWVVQVDAPEDRDMYIHRVGRTARYRAGGKSLLFVTPGEERRGLISKLQGSTAANKLPLKKVSINPNKTAIVTQRAASVVASEPKLGELAKKAYKSYLRSVHLMPDKAVFDVRDIDTDAFAQSLGLALTPTLGFLKAIKDRDENRKKKNVNHKLHRLKEQIKAEKLAKKLQSMGQSTSDEARQSHAERSGDASRGSDSDDDDDDEVLVPKSSSHWSQLHDEDEPLPDVNLNEVSKSRHPKKIRILGSNLAGSKRIVFNDDGEEQDANAVLHDIGSHNDPEEDDGTRLAAADLKQASQDFVSKVQKRLLSTKEQDKLDEKERVRQKHKKRRLKEKGEALGELRGGQLESDGYQVTLGSSLKDEPLTSRARDSDSSDSSTASSDSSSSDDDDDDETNDVTAQEELALSLIRGKGATAA
jgi:ATP-dependent RNA helicase DDX10/DBP4